MDKQNQILELLEKQGPNLMALLTRLTLREEIAEELMQELFIKLNNSRALYKAENPDAYARTSAINLAFDWRRKQKRTKIIPGNIQTTTQKNDCPLSRIIQQEQFDEVLDAIGRLKHIYREILIMRYIQQQSYEEISEVFGKKAHQVRALCAKALAKLRNILCGNEESVKKEEVSND